MHDHEELPAPLRRAVEHMREEPAVRPEWRSALLERAAERDVIPMRTRRVSIPLPMAIAAGLACALVGGAVMRTVDRPAKAVAAAAVDTLPVHFSVVAPNAAQVTIVGDFNHWNPTSLPMRRSSDGRVWEVDVRLPLGRYSYSYLIDGKLAADPSAPRGVEDDFGSPNSVLMVRGS
jgi:hypothetical protein